MRDSDLGCPKLRNTFWGPTVKRIIVFWGLRWDPTRVSGFRALSLRVEYMVQWLGVPQLELNFKVYGFQRLISHTNACSLNPTGSYDGLPATTMKGVWSRRGGALENPRFRVCMYMQLYIYMYKDIFAYTGSTWRYKEATRAPLLDSVLGV